MHQGDRDGVKGIYLINLIDQTTQFELVAAVAAISERFLPPVLTGLLEQMPFRIRGFHTDNGSEYVNRRVADLLAKLHVEFTRSRPGAATTTPWSKARTPTWCASTSATTISPSASPPRWTRSPGNACRPS